MQQLRTIFFTRDMTQGESWKRNAEFAFPMLVGNIAQQLYSSTDSAVVGRYVGDDALASVGSTGAITFFLIALFVGISTGAGIVVAQSFGARDRERLSITIGNCIALNAITSLIMMVIGVVLSRPLLLLLNTTIEIIDDAVTYLQITFLGIISLTYYYILSGILRGWGTVFPPWAFCFWPAA
jgi:Na+-driven multidrug efflux pump